MEVETYAGKVLKPEEMEDVEIGTEDYASVLLEFDSGAHGVLTVNRCEEQEPALLRDQRRQVQLVGSGEAE